MISYMKIGLDCRLAGAKHAGIGRYIANLLQELIKDSEVNWVLFFYDREQVEEVLGKDTKKQNIKIIIAPVRHYTLAEQLKMPAIFAKEKLDLLHVPHFNVPIFYSGKLVVTIHDLLWHHHRGQSVTTLPPWQYWLKYGFYRLVTGMAVKKAKRILVPAETIKDTVSHYYPRAKDKVIVTREGVEPVFRDKTLLKTTKKPAKNLLFVGSLYPHKNVRLIITALKLLPEYTLTIVGTRSVFADEVKKFVAKSGLSDRVKFAGRLTDYELAKAYSNAFALVQPSFSEGFGLTGVEAMASGAPVLASDIPIFREIYQDAALFFDPYSAQAFVAAVKKLGSSNREKFISRGRAVSAQYDWQHTAQITAAAYRELV